MSRHTTTLAVSALSLAALTALSGCIVVVGNRGGAYEARTYTNDGTRTKRIGVELDRVSNTLAAQLAIDGDRAAVITRVALNSAAERAGLERHDVIIAINGDRKAAIADIRDAVEDRKPGDTMVLTILRGGETREITVEVERR